MEKKKAENGQRGGLLPRVHRKQTVKECFHRSLLKTGGVLVSARLIVELKRPIIQFSRLVFAHLSAPSCLAVSPPHILESINSFKSL